MAKKILAFPKSKSVDNNKRKISKPVAPDHNLFKVIAVKKLPLWRWEITDDCPYQQEGRYPLLVVAAAVDNGDLITAQRRVGPFHFELLAKVPEKSVE